MYKRVLQLHACNQVQQIRQTPVWIQTTGNIPEISHRSHHHHSRALQYTHLSIHIPVPHVIDDSASTPHYKRTSLEQRQGAERGKVPRSGGQSNAPGTRPEEQPGANGLVSSYQGQVRGQPSVVPWGSRLGLCFPPVLFLRMITAIREVQSYQFPA